MEVIFLLSVVAFMVIISYFLAKRAMRDFQDEVTPHLNYQPFLIRNPQLLDNQVLKLLTNFMLTNKSFISFEKLFKGQDSVLIIFAPISFKEKFDFLQPLELEDYVSPATLSRSFAFLINLGSTIKTELFKELLLTEDQRFFFQIVCFPVKRTENFQVTLRGMTVDKSVHQRIELAKKITKDLRERGFIVNEKKSSKLVFKAFVKRNFVPLQVQKSQITGDELLALIK